MRLFGPAGYGPGAAREAAEALANFCAWFQMQVQFSLDPRFPRGHICGAPFPRGAPAMALAVPAFATWIPHCSS